MEKSDCFWQSWLVEVLVDDQLGVIRSGVFPMGVDVLDFLRRKLVRLNQVLQVEVVHQQIRLASMHAGTQLVDTLRQCQAGLVTMETIQIHHQDWHVFEDLLHQLFVGLKVRSPCVVTATDPAVQEPFRDEVVVQRSDKRPVGDDHHVRGESVVELFFNAAQLVQVGIEYAVVLVQVAEDEVPVTLAFLEHREPNPWVTVNYRFGQALIEFGDEVVFTHRVETVDKDYAWSFLNWHSCLLKFVPESLGSFERVFISEKDFPGTLEEFEIITCVHGVYMQLKGFQRTPLSKK